MVAVALSTAAAASEGTRPLVFAFQKQKDPVQVKAGADRMAALLAEALGRPVKAFVPTDYSATVQALVSRQADFAYISAIPFLLARRDGGATILLAEKRLDSEGRARTSYDSALVVRRDSPLRSLEDLRAQARKTRVSFTSTTSTSGYVMAYSRLVSEGILAPRQQPKEVFRSVNFAGSYGQALRQVLERRAEVAAVSAYTVEGSTADVYLRPEERANLRVLARTPDVPTHLVCARGGIDPALREQVKRALLDLAAREPRLLEQVYGASTLVEVDEQAHVRAAVDALDRLGVPIEAFAR